MRTTRWVGAAVVLAGAGWAAGRIARGPARVDIRAFDPDEVARLETAKWRIEAVLRLAWRSLAAEVRAGEPAR